MLGTNVRDLSKSDQMKRGGIVKIIKGRRQKIENKGKVKGGRIGRMELVYQRMAEIQNSGGDPF